MFYSFKWLKPYLFQYKSSYLTSYLLGLLQSLMELVPPLLIGMAIDHMEGGTLTMDLIFQYLLWTVLVLIVSYFSGWKGISGLLTAAHRVRGCIRKDYMALCLSKRQPFYEHFPSGDLMARMTNDIDSLFSLSAWGLMSLLNNGSYVLLLVIVMVWKGGWLLTLSTLLSFFVLTYLGVKLGAGYELAWQKQEEEFSKLNNSVLEGVEGIRSIRAFSMEPAFSRRFVRQTESLRTRNNDFVKVNALYKPATQTALLLSSLCLFSLGAYLILRGDLTVGTLITFHVYLSEILWPMISLGELVPSIRQANASARRLDQLRDFQEEFSYGDLIPEAFESLELRNFSFSYPTSPSPVLKDLSLSFQRGMTVGVCGKTGHGKSALLTLPLREYPLEEGLFLNGRDIRSYQKGSISPLLGYVSQDNLLFSGSLRDNVLFGSSKDHDDQDILHVLEVAGFVPEKENMQEGLDTKIGENGITLSGGQKQRVCIARALLADPDLLILDDSLSAVDSETEQRMVDHLKEERKGKTNLIAEQRLSSIRDADLIVVLDDGRISQCGTHEDLMKSGGWYASQYLHQSRGEEVL